MNLFVAKNWFLRTDAENDDTRNIFYPCGIPYRNLLVISVYVSNVHHLSQLPDFLVALDLEIP